jgi:hypothetical protein
LQQIGNEKVDSGANSVPEQRAEIVEMEKSIANWFGRYLARSTSIAFGKLFKTECHTPSKRATIKV